MKKYTRNFVSILLIFLLISITLVPALAVNSSETTTADMRMQPLIDRYKGLTKEQLSAELVKYTDSVNHWGKNYISKISALEIISGYGNGKFGPNDTLLGGQYVLMLVRTIGYKPEVPQGVPYYKPFVDIALKEGILKSGEISDYMKPITRELAASLARRTVGLYEEVPHDYFVPGVDTEGTGKFGFFDNVYVGYQKTKITDFLNITNSRLQDVLDCYRMGLLTGSNYKFIPKGNLTRAEAAVIIVKLLDKTSRVESVPSENESFKFANALSTSTPHGYCSDETGYYEGKEYTLYKGYFPFIEIWDTVNAMYKNQSKINTGAVSLSFCEKDKGFGMGWFQSKEVEYDFRMNNLYGLILPEIQISTYTYKTAFKKGEPESIYDNAEGYLYGLNVWNFDVPNYNNYVKNYTYELMKVWFGNEYTKAKSLHDQYLSYAVNDQDNKSAFYLINGRQVKFSGGRGEFSGNGFTVQVWAKDVITKDTMFKY